MQAINGSNSGGINPAIQAATTGKAFDAAKQQGEAAIQLIQSATDDSQNTSSSSGPTPTGNVIDVEA